MNNNILDLREMPQENISNPTPKRSGSFKRFRNIFLTIVLLISISVSAAKVIKAAGAPDPGHLWSEIEDVALTITRGGTGLDIIGTPDQALIVNVTGDALKYQTLSTDIITEGTNCYYTESYFDTSLATKTTDNLIEGAANIYYTDARVNNVLSTWPGTTNITTLGGITAGTWNGTTIAVNKGGTGQTSYTNGQLLIGNTTGNTLTKATLTGTANRVIVTNGSGSITLSTPQNIATTSSPTFAGLTLTGLGGILKATAGVFSGDATTSDLPEGANLYYTDARFDTRLATKTTDNLIEGPTNFYWTQGRFDTALSGKTTSNLTEGTNLYYTTARHDADFDTHLGTKNTDNLTEGTANLYCSS